jgi:5-methylcytosine-specific restriction endonuclease McrA
VRRSSPLTRRSPRARRQPLRSRRRPVEMTAERAAWKDTGAGHCQCCGRFDMLKGHHVVAAQTIRAEGKPGMLWDLRNRMLVAPHCHEQHTSAFRRFHVDRLPESALEFAREFWGDDLRAALYIARTYRGEL